ncbi:MAG: T9SS type A sorting domain-containing protein [Flavobacteriaceae bacterium]|nr:T9SS type A sorting domain-containing protein [Flavobacteriaceae bacterium]NNK59398.1 T9SS type A sorting domain-containing protein [Flavobacteriaceae bacterium]
MKKILTLLFILLCYFSFAQEIQELYQRAKISYTGISDLIQLSELDIPIDHGVHKPGHFIISEFSQSELERARTAGYSVEILIYDLKAKFLEENRHPLGSTRNPSCLTGNETYNTPSNFQLGTMGGYLTYQELLDELDEMASLYPNLITTKANISTFLTEGQADNSTSPPIGGNGIKWVKISDNPNSNAEGEAQILYTSIHHAREPSTLSQLVFYMWYLLENYATDPEVQSIVDNTELYFIPVVNPDGYLYNEKIDPNGGGFWRKNRYNGHGVDNNRNYNYHINGDANNGSWGGPGSSGNTNSEIYRGNAPFSEIENQAVKWFVEQHNFVIALNNHSFGQLLYFPFGYADVATPDEALYQSLTGELVSRNGYNALRDFPFSGDSDDFMYGTVGTHSKIFAMTTEVGNSFWPASNQIENLCKDMMYLNLTAANMVNNFATLNDNTPTFITSTTASAAYTIKRLGLADPANFTVSVNPISTNIVSVGAPNTHNNLNYAEEISSAITINLNNNISTGEQIEYELIINNGVFDKSVMVSKVFGQPTIALDDLGNDTSNWSTSGWFTTSEDFVSASTSITDSPNSNYSSNENSAITLLNAIDLTGLIDANLTFQAKWNIENNFDYVQIEVSTNNGSSWIPQCGKYTNTGVPNQNGANNEPVYDGVQNDWVLETIELSDYIDQSILIRFRIVSDGVVEEDGFYFDDLKINILENNLGIEDFIINNFKIFPNPTENILNIQSSLQDYDIEIRNIQGQLILNRSLVQGSMQLDYSKYASGMYLLNIKSAGKSRTFKIIKQ